MDGAAMLKEEGAEETRESKRSWPSEEGGKLDPYGGGTAGTGAAVEGNSRCWSGCGDCGGMSALVRSVCAK